jgi:phosphoribosylformylglycinamidine synthase
MTMNYGDQAVRAPGTVVVSAAGECTDVRKAVTPDLKAVSDSRLFYVNLSGVGSSPLGGSSLAQVCNAVGGEVPTIGSAAQFKATFNVVQELVQEGRILAGHDVSSGGLIAALCEMAFGGKCGLRVSGLSVAGLFSEKPALVLQLAEADYADISSRISATGASVIELGQPADSRILIESTDGVKIDCTTEELFKSWVKPSYLLDCKQTKPELAKERLDNSYLAPLNFVFPDSFEAAGYEARKGNKGVTAAIVREKGTNGDREMAYSLYAAGFEVKDITMFDLMSGKETLEDVSFVVFPGGFSNSDVLGAGRGWAGAIRYNDNAQKAIDAFFSRPDTMSLGVCNGCQLVVELGLLVPEQPTSMKLTRNASGKFESSFLSVDIKDSPSIMLKPLVGSRLGVWVAHGEGQFVFDAEEAPAPIALQYTHSGYPMNPNGSVVNTAGVSSVDGRHLAMMPHPERALLPWQWPYYPADRKKDAFSPWIEAFGAAYDWLKAQ